MSETPTRIPAIDTHCHVYPDFIAERAVSGIGGFYGRPIQCDGKLDTILKLGKAAGTAHFLMSSVATTPHQVESINRFLSGVHQQNASVMHGLGTLHPDSPDQAGDVRRLKELGLIGVKLHPDIQGVAIDDPRYFKIFELCGDTLPVCCHFGDKRYDYSNPNRVMKVVKAFPWLKLIGAHFGGWSIWEQAAEKLPACPSLYVDSSSSLFTLTPERAVEIIRKFGANRVLYGSDYPMWRPEEERERFDALPLTEEERERILYKNASELYGLNIFSKCS